MSTERSSEFTFIFYRHSSNSFKVELKFNLSSLNSQFGGLLKLRFVYSERIEHYLPYYLLQNCDKQELQFSYAILFQVEYMPLLNIWTVICEYVLLLLSCSLQVFDPESNHSSSDSDQSSTSEEESDEEPYIDEDWVPDHEDQVEYAESVSLNCKGYENR